MPQVCGICLDGIDHERRLADPTWLRYFVSVVQTGSMAAAAAACGVTVGAVHHGIKSLEVHIGAELFDRSRRGSYLNATGRAYKATIVSAYVLLGSLAQPSSAND